MGTATMTTDALSLQRLLSWTSPSFPIGAFSFSGGLEGAIEVDLVRDRQSLADWCRFHLEAGAALQDGWTVLAAMRTDRPADLNALSLAMRQSRETRQEVALLGDAFAKVMTQVWELDLPKGFEGEKAYPVLFGLAAKAFGISETATLVAFFHAWLANQVSVACRIIPLGQTDGQRTMFFFEDTLAELALSLCNNPLNPDEPPATAALVADWCSVTHETQYSRLFRS